MMLADEQSVVVMVEIRGQIGGNALPLLVRDGRGDFTSKLQDGSDPARRGRTRCLRSSATDILNQSPNVIRRIIEPGALRLALDEGPQVVG